MYDFTRFIDVLNKKPDSFKEALNLVKNDFHIGKVEVKSNEFLERLEFVFDPCFVDKIVMTYTYGDYEYSFYKNSDKHKYTEDELKDIFFLIRMFGLYHSNYILKKKENERY